MNPVDIILTKRRGGRLSAKQIEAFVRGATDSSFADYQLAALLMAICINGMDEQETVDLTMSMARSGDMLDLSSVRGVKVDKHSTGGVGDSTTLIAAPLVAACGGTVAKLSGRGLGHTGGTLDKLESVPGVNIELSMERFKEIVSQIGVCVMGQTGNFVPADKLMYALRDVTGTVEGIPLIASSVMSKKLASGSDAIVLDVKAGSGAFMHTPEDAETLARTMVDIGNRMGRRTMALITDMNQPLGLAVGNALEIIEVYDALSGKLDKNDPLLSVSLTLAGKMLILSNLAGDMADAKAKLIRALESGEGLNKLKLMLSALGGRDEFVEDPYKLVSGVKQRIDIYPAKDGYIGDMHADMIGISAQLLGAGRAKKGDSIDPATGLVMHVRRGDRVTTRDALATMYVNDASHLDEARQTFVSAIRIEDEISAHIPMVYKEVD